MIYIKDSDKQHYIIRIKEDKKENCVLIVRKKYFKLIEDNIVEIDDKIHLANILLPSAERDVEQTEVSAADNGGRNRKSAIL